MGEKTKDLVSVVIPTYNRAYCLGKAIDSVLSQTHTRVEVLVVDDGSSDNTQEVVATQYRNDPRVRYQYQSNAGVSTARNTGFSLATGDYIALLDSDDWWDASKLELQLAAFAKRPDVGMIWTDMRAINSSGAMVAERFLRTMYSTHKWFPTETLFNWSMQASELAPQYAAEIGDAKFYAGDIFSQMVAGNLAHTSTVVMTRERMEKVGGMRPDYAQAGEDYEYYVRTCLEGPVGFLDLPTMTYQKGREDQVTTTCSLPVARNFLATFKNSLSLYRDRITLSPEIIDKVLAEAHRWIGSELVRAKQYGEGRQHLKEGLRREFEWSALLSLLSSYVPHALLPHARTGLKHIRNLTAIRMLPFLLLLNFDLAADLLGVDVIENVTALIG